MRKMLRYGGLMLALVVALTAMANAQVGGLGGQAPKAPPQPGHPGEVSGKVSVVGGSSKTVTVQVEFQAYEPNAAAQRNNTNNSRLNQIYRLQMQIQRDQMQMQQSRNQQTAMRTMMALQRDMARLQMEMARLGGNPQQAPFKVVTKKQDYEIETDDNTKVRFLQPPLAFDEKGNPKKYTDAELKELKGADAKLPGYQGSFDQLRPGHVVRIAVGKKTATKAAPKETKDLKDLDKPKDLKDLDKPAVPVKDLDKVPGAPSDDKPYAVLILITGEEAPPGAQKKKK